jgi:hypothetical protein
VHKPIQWPVSERGEPCNPPALAPIRSSQAIIYVRVAGITAHFTGAWVTLWGSRSRPEIVTCSDDVEEIGRKHPMIDKSAVLM